MQGLEIGWQRRAAVWLVAGVIALGAFVQGAGACVLPPPERVRRSVPGDGETGVPTSVRPRVSYKQGPLGQMQCAPDAPAPAIRLAGIDGGVFVDGGDGVAGTWVKTTDDDPRAGVTWEFHPGVPLLPNTVYELVDGYPGDCKCANGGCAAQPLAAFVRFTTGAAADATPPTFSGLAGSFCVHDNCLAGDQQCCGPYNHFVFSFVAKQDASDANLVGLHLYLRKEGDAYDFTHPLGPLSIADPIDAPVAPRWDATLSPGTWHVVVRAFDSSGNEDANTREETFQFPLAMDIACRKVIEDGGVVRDMSIPSPDLTPRPAIEGGADAGLDGTIAGGGCGCAVGRRNERRSEGMMFLFSVFLVLGMIATMGIRRGRRGR